MYPNVQALVEEMPFSERMDDTVLENMVDIVLRRSGLNEELDPVEAAVYRGAGRRPRRRFGLRELARILLLRELFGRRFDRRGRFGEYYAGRR